MINLIRSMEEIMDDNNLLNDDDKILPSNPEYKEKAEKQKSSEISHLAEIEVKTLDEYITIIEKYKNEGFSFYRGDKFSDINNIELIPKVYKEEYKCLCDTHDEAITEFAELTTGKISIASNGFLEDMINAQHYELPTRLLDWSESALIALYFAVFPKINKNNETPLDSIIWLLHPIQLNSKTELHGLISIDKNDSPSIEKYYKSEEKSGLEKYPLAVKTRKINPRIDAQQGVFVLFCKYDRHKSLHLYSDAKTFLKRIIIKQKNAINIYNSLVSLGITQYSIFPEPQSISIDIIVRRNKDLGGK